MENGADRNMSHECNLERLGQVIDEIAPEVADVWLERYDIAEDEGIKTGRLHENRILGLKLRYTQIGEERTTTSDLEDEYELFFKKIARSTVSTYLNQLVKDGVLAKERDGRVVYYLFSVAPPRSVDPFWFVRNFCTTPAYLARAAAFAHLYQEISKGKRGSTSLQAQQFLLGLAILRLLYKRFEKCFLCQFATKSAYRRVRDLFEQALNDRQDVLPEKLRDYLFNQLGDLPIFGGTPFLAQHEDIQKNIEVFAEQYQKDIEFQIMVSQRRQELRLKQRASAPEKVAPEPESPETETPGE
jgi:DNA-binding transcriptional ArsR family regulator